MLVTGIQPENHVEIWLVILFFSRKKFHTRQVFVLISSMKLGPDKQHCSVLSKFLCLQAFLFFCLQLSDTFLAALERLMIVQIGSYPRMPHRHRFLCDRSVLLILIALAPKGPTLKNFLSKVGKFEFESNSYNIQCLPHICV